MKKEDIGTVVKKAARLIPGIGSYQDRQSLREADKTLRLEISRRLDDLIGVLEWVKTDQLKKGAWKRIEEIEDVERDFEKASKVIERAARGFGSVFDGPKVDEEVLQKVYEHDKQMWGLLEPIERKVSELAEKGKVIESAALESIRETVRNLMQRIKQREGILKGLSVPADNKK